jgi:hypothetical protein
MRYLIALVAIIALGGCTVPEDTGPGGGDTTTSQHAKNETSAQKNAREKAADYLAYSAFSRRGLIQQLKFEGFDVKDAKYAADAVGADWNKQAAGKAKEYLELDSYSHDGLVEQLKFDGFTAKQAEYGVTKAGL